MSQKNPSTTRLVKPATTATTVISSAPVAPVAQEILQLSGQELPLVRLTFNDLIQIEAAHGSVEALFQKVQAQQLTAIRYLVWLCLRKGTPDLTEETVGDLLPLHADALAGVLERISGACGIAA